MHKRILALSLVIVFACASLVLFTRHLVERANNVVSLLMDGPDIVAHAAVTDMDPVDYLIALREAGLFGLVVPYDRLELRDMATESGLAVVLLFDGEPVSADEHPEAYDLADIAGFAFHNSDTTDAFLEVLSPSERLLFLIQRNDTFQGYLPSPVHAELISRRVPAVRTYRISRLETDAPEYHPANMIQRWLVNIREYNTRAIYARPYFDGDLAKNVQFISDAAQSLAAAGYELGLAQPMRVFSLPRPVMAVLVTFAALCAVLVAAALGLPPVLLTAGSAGAVLVGFSTLLARLALPARLLVALAGSVAASILGILWAVRSRRGNHFMLRYVAVNLITVFLALSVAAVLSSTDFFMEYYVFRGVKVQYIAPLVLLAAYLLVKLVGAEGLRTLRRSSPCIHWLLLLALAAIPVVFMYRSGDVDNISTLESGFRSFLERLFVVRPRLKELVAHPALMLSLYWQRRVPRVYFAAGLLLGAIGQVSIVNTFLHLRTPLALSLLRTWHGLWLGTALGLIAVALSVVLVRAASVRGDLA